MNLDLEHGRIEDGGSTADGVEIITEGTSGPRSPPHHAQEARPPVPLSSGWIDQSSLGHSTVVRRRPGLHLQDKMRAWRRHTVVV